MKQHDSQGRSSEAEMLRVLNRHVTYRNVTSGHDRMLSADVVTLESRSHLIGRTACRCCEIGSG